jgi:hypothetical protein
MVSLHAQLAPDTRHRKPCARALMLMSYSAKRALDLFFEFRGSLQKPLFFICQNIENVIVYKTCLKSIYLIYDGVNLEMFLEM